MMKIEKNDPSKPNSSSPPTSTNSHSTTITVSSAPFVNPADSPPRQPDASAPDQKSVQPTAATNVTGLNSTNPIDKQTLQTEDKGDVTTSIIDTPEMTTGSLQKQYQVIVTKISIFHLFTVRAGSELLIRVNGLCCNDRCKLVSLLFSPVFKNGNKAVGRRSYSVIVDHEFLDTEYEVTLNKIKYLVDQIIRDDLRDGVGISVRYYSWTQIRFNRDFTIVMSVSNCKDTWQIFHEVQQETLLLIALTEANCPRLPIPILNIGEELPQILLDIRSSQVVSWKSSIILYDSIFDRDSVSKVVSSLSSLTQRSEAAVMSISLFRIDDTDTNYRSSVRKTLQGLQSKTTGKHFLVVTERPHIVMEEAQKIGLTDTSNQWLFIILKNTTSKHGTLPIMKFVNEGGNIAVAINSTQSNGECLSGILCHFEETFKILVEALTKMIKKESAIYGQISDEEWEAIRLTKKERRDGMLEIIMDHFSHKQVCSSCCKWDFLATETWGTGYADAGLVFQWTVILNSRTKNQTFVTSGKNRTLQINRAATWEATNGVLANDSLFPHITYGFRGKTLPIATYHNPPWQIIQYGDNGEVISTKGVVMQILNELAEKLNFTSNLVPPEVFQLMTTKNVRSNEPCLSNCELYNKLSTSLRQNYQIILGAIAATVDENNTHIVNYTRPISIQSYSFLVSRPKELSRLYLFTAPFTVDVRGRIQLQKIRILLRKLNFLHLQTWVCLILTVMIIGPILFCIHYISPYNDYHNVIKKGGLYKVGNCFWYIYGALLQQGGTYLPSSDSGRLIVGTWWLGVLVVVTTYCGGTNFLLCN
ncbi:hypothetical protein HA402_003564 [Bradysia odoriphaga]|nr:hypothetical protein HA402_003564 [Bradysia odoriphaga]